MNLQATLGQIRFNSPDSINDIIGKFCPIVFEKNEHLLKEGQISDTLFFIDSGIVHEYSRNYADADADADADTDTDTDTEKKSTHWIAGKKEWIFQIKSFIECKPSFCNIQALEKTTVYALKKSEFQGIMKEYPETLSFVMSMYERYLLTLEDRTTLQRLKPASRRLELFEKYNGDIACRLPQHVLASFLNITPSELSRIRAKRAKSQK
jgi:CRP/FNR family transcriptional regulator, anaerobic regulatory protein